MKNIFHGEKLSANREAEEAALGSILRRSQTVDIVNSYLQEDDFYYPEHSLIYKAILSLNSRRKPIDTVTVMTELMEAGKLEEAGNAFKLTELQSKAASTADENVTYCTLAVLTNAVERNCKKIFYEGVSKIHQGEDIADVMAWTDKEMQKQQERLVGKKDTSHISEAAKKSLGEMYDRIESQKKGRTTGIPTGLKRVDERTGGWQNSELVVIAARPAMGKTAFALHFTKKAAEANYPVAVFSLEMSDVSLSDRLILTESRVNPSNYKMGKMSQDEINAIEKAVGILDRMPIYIDDNPNSSMSYIRTKARLLHKQGKCKMIVIDYLQLVAEDAKGSFREQQVAKMSREAKMIAKELNIPVLLLSQLNRKSTERDAGKPLLSDLRESGAIEQDADKVFLINRPDLFGKPLELNGSVVENGISFDLAKNRSGATVEFALQHDGTLHRIFTIGTEPTTKAVKSESMPF